MNTKEELEMQVEQLQSRLYDASESKLNYDKIIKISRELDSAKNKLENLEQAKEKHFH
ncbi:Spo0E family sporulation regulatory protein-aspartic acid phosphatase [Oceanobacillus damuensis]|uniref:Spo0E family sporulation regulatory protein-aspartic acid phosphatase n=1 Tax=Oceanobacillus damuensis TaxID=937928 RepID=UPI000AD22516|nr:Spo0E family sporulation regulatory protein-aspartic acid phosphatase [Oceanobacillus damuensis]